MTRQIILLSLILGLFSCTNSENNQVTTETYPDILITGAMKDVMWNGELFGKINLDTISNKSGLYGIGPESYLTGELLINDGKSYVSKVLTDSTMIVEATYAVEAPFFVYGNVMEWTTTTLPDSVTNIKELETLIDQLTRKQKRPFTFKLSGEVTQAFIHIQNLPPGSKVSNPDEAHVGQTNYELTSEAVDIIGFFSTEHQAVFTHHDTYLHMHLITQDEKQMGHLDMVRFSPGKMKLYLPKK